MSFPIPVTHSNYWHHSSQGLLYGNSHVQERETSRILHMHAWDLNMHGTTQACLITIMQRRSCGRTHRTTVYFMHLKFDEKLFWKPSLKLIHEFCCPSTSCSHAHSWLHVVDCSVVVNYSQYSVHIAIWAFFSALISRCISLNFKLTGSWNTATAVIPANIVHKIALKFAQNLDPLNSSTISIPISRLERGEEKGLISSVCTCT